MLSITAHQIFVSLQEVADDERADPMAKYMKNHFPFMGITSPVRKAWFKEFKKNNELPKGEELIALVQDCYDYSEREMHYVALEFLDARKRYWTEDYIELFEYLILKNQWWDTVDWLSTLVGKYFLKFPERKGEITQRWNHSDDMWLNRVSIIFQLHSKDKADWPMIQRYILNHKDRQEFFIRKAQGWALRQYSKTHPREVGLFISEHPDLSKLTIREGSKYL